MKSWLVQVPGCLWWLKKDESPYNWVGFHPLYTANNCCVPESKYLAPESKYLALLILRECNQKRAEHDNVFSPVIESTVVFFQKKTYIKDCKRKHRTRCKNYISTNPRGMFLWNELPPRTRRNRCFTGPWNLDANIVQVVHDHDNANK